MNIITLHHLACSGGTVFSKAVAALKGVILLSEIHPDRHLENRYDPVAQLHFGYSLKDEERGVFDELYLDNLAACAALAERRGCRLIIRDHCHRDFVEFERGASRLVELLRRRFTVLPIVTLRDPVDTWISYRQRGWFRTGDPGQLCARMLNLVRAFDGAPVFKYEDLIDSPHATLRALCAVAQIDFHDDFLERMPQITHMTGNSGRTGDVLSRRRRQRIFNDEVRSFLGSPHYAQVCTQFDYPKLQADAGYWHTGVGRFLERLRRVPEHLGSRADES